MIKSAAYTWHLPLMSAIWKTLQTRYKIRAACRLTLVKGWNMEELKDYVKLLELGQPDFIEIKGAALLEPFCSFSVFLQT